MNMYLQSLLRCGHRSPVCGILQVQKRCTVPAAGDLREEPVLNGIELGTIRRIMNDKKSDTQFVGKVHKILLDDSVRAGVRASAVAQDNKGAGIGVYSGANGPLNPRENHRTQTVPDSPRIIFFCIPSVSIL